MNIGYARVSTEEQNLDLQIGALEAAGCDTIYEDRGISGAAAYRPGLADVGIGVCSSTTVMRYSRSRQAKFVTSPFRSLEKIRATGFSANYGSMGRR